MKRVSQVIPKEQVDILVEALNALESKIKSGEVNSEDEATNYKLFDILTLRAMLNKTEMVNNVPMDLYENFTAENGVDFPIYF